MSAYIFAFVDVIDRVRYNDMFSRQPVEVTEVCRIWLNL